MRIVEATSVEDYLNRYYKKTRFIPELLDSYREDFERDGYVCTSHHDNVIGEFIAWPFYPHVLPGGYERSTTCNITRE